MSPVLTTRRIALRQVEQRDLAMLSAWQLTEDYREFVTERADAKKDIRYLIICRNGERPIGEIYTFSHNKRDGYLFLNVFMNEKYRNRGYGAEACILLICHLFENEGLYKIYCDAFAHNHSSLSMMRTAGLAQEGLLKGHRLYRGARHDVARFAVHQENLPHLWELLRRFTTKNKSERIIRK